MRLHFPPPRKEGVARTLSLQYVRSNILLLVLPLATIVVYYLLSIQSAERLIDAQVVEQLSEQVARTERLLTETESIFSELDDDWDLEYYLNKSGPLSAIEQYNLKRLSSKLATYALSDELLISVFVHLQDSDFIVANTGFYPFDRFYGLVFDAEGKTGAQWKAEYLQDAAAPRMSDLIRYRFFSTGELQEKSGFIYRKSFGLGAYKRGTAFAVLDTQSLQRALSTVPGPYRGWTFLVGEGRRLIAASSPDFPEGLLSESASGKGRIEWKGETYRVYRQQSYYNGWGFCTVLSEGSVFQYVRKVRNLALLLVAAAFIVGLALSFASAYTHSRPLARIFSLLLPKAESPRRLSELYDEAQRAASRMSDENSRLALEATANASRIRALFFRNLLAGNYTDKKRLEADQASFGLRLSAQPAFLILCCSDEDYQQESRDDFEEAVRNVAALFSDETDHVVALSYATIAIIHYPAQGAADDRALKERLALMRQCLRASGMDALIGVSRICDDPFLLPVAYQECRIAIKSLEATGQAVQLFDEYMEPGGDACYYPLELESALAKAVEAGSADIFRSLWARLSKENLVVRRPCPRLLRDLCYELKGTLDKAIVHANWPPSQPVPDVQSADFEKHGLALFQDYERCFLALVGFYRSKTLDSNEAKLSAIQGFIHKNIGMWDLGLTTIARNFELSECYLSSFFHEQSGERLSDYIQRRRLELSCSLLVETRLSVDEIASQSGYQRGSSFRRAFKRELGLSPSEYRLRKQGPLAHNLPSESS